MISRIILFVIFLTTILSIVIGIILGINIPDDFWFTFLWTGVGWVIVTVPAIIGYFIFRKEKAKNSRQIKRIRKQHEVPQQKLLVCKHCGSNSKPGYTFYEKCGKPIEK